MQIIHSNSLVNLKYGEEPNYDLNNPLNELQKKIQNHQLAAEREHYLPQSIQHILPFNQLTLYPRKNPESNNIADIKKFVDFQHQNIQNIKYSDIQLSRGWANLNGQTFPFVRISYRGGPDSQLSQTALHTLSNKIKLWIRIGDNLVNQYLEVPYNPLTDQYDIELWGYTGQSTTDHLDTKGQAALKSGELQIRPDLIKGKIEDFLREHIEKVEICNIHKDNCMHPILPLKIELAWTDYSEKYWDSMNSQNYIYEFNMIYRGWDNFLKVGTDSNPHGGTGVLHFRTLLSNYWGYPDRPYSTQATISQVIKPWMRDAYGNKPNTEKTDNFFKVEYMDMHILKPDCAIGLHRHQDNQEVFFMLEGEGLMVIGDWNKMDSRERCLEVRTLKAGHFVMLKGGNLHALINTKPDPAMLFIFGGYD